MTEPMILTLLAAAAALLGGLITAYFQKQAQDREFSRRTKREFYDTLLDHLWDSNLADSQEQRDHHASQFLKMTTKIAIYGSDQVVARMAEMMGINNLYDPHDQRKITRLISAMRVDLRISGSSDVEEDIHKIVFERPNRIQRQEAK